MDPKAKERFDKGSAHYNLGEYDKAITEFKEAYRIEPRPQFLWAIAQSHRLKGDYAAAIRGYEAFLRAGPTQSGAALALEQITLCQTKLANAPAPESPPPPAQPSVIVKSPEAATAPRTPPPAQRWRGDLAGHALLWTGVAALVAGGALLVIGDVSIAGVASQETYGGYLDARGNARTLQYAGIGLLAGGGALAASGLIRFGVVADHERKGRVPSVSGSVTPTGAALWVAGAF